MSIRLPQYYSALSIVILSIYGIAVCPFIDSLPAINVVLEMAVAFTLQTSLQIFLTRKFVEPFPIRRRSFQQFKSDISTYLLTGAGLGLFNNFFYGFPLESATKVMVGAITLGLFASIDNALVRGRYDFEKLSLVEDANLKLDKELLFPITLKLSLFISMIMLLTTFILSLVLYKDTIYLFTSFNESPMKVLRAFQLDVAYVMLTVLALGLKVLYSYSKNIKKLFEFQIDTMQQVSQGNLSVRAPVVTRDEFRVIAQQTNQMISGLEEKELIRDRFGKAVSPQIAEILINNVSAEIEKGQYCQVVVLFCDIRNFTAKSETEKATDVVAVLNDYFTLMVNAVEKHGGMVDKFIGDALLATFGFEGGDPAINAANAVNAANEMRIACSQLHWPDATPFSNGIGIHSGQVIAATIGAPGRHEFTIIGDVVNTASRIESMCCKLEEQILVSATVYQQLPADLQASFIEAGDHQLKGKLQAVTLFKHK